MENDGAYSGGIGSVGAVFSVSLADRRGIIRGIPAGRVRRRDCVRETETARLVMASKRIKCRRGNSRFGFIFGDCIWLASNMARTCIADCR